MDLQILSRKLIKPSTPTPQHSSSYTLSFFDQIALQVHVPRVYFYSNNGNTINDHNTISNQLEKSLSKTLTRFYPLAGRFSSDGQSVDCLDQGVEFLLGRANYQLAKFLPKFYEDTSLLDHFVPWDIARDPTSIKTPLLAIQVTFFTCGGFALTFLASHILLDGFSYSTFINQWAAMSRFGELTEEHICPSFTLGTVFPPRDVSLRIRSPPPAKRPSGAKIIMKVFVFNAANISAMKDKCSHGGIGKQPSRVGVVTALVWRTLIRVTQARNGGQLRASRLSFALGLRGGRTNPALSAPDNGFGNLYLLSSVNFLGDKHMMELRDLVGLSQDTAQWDLRSCGNAQTDNELFSIALDLLNETRDPDLCHGEVDDCFFTSLCRFPLYEADFGWGKPYWISSLNLQREMFTLVDTKCGNGIEARVCLNEVDMLRFESDPYIKAFASEPDWLISPNQMAASN